MRLLSCLGDERKSGAIWYANFRQSPKADQSLHLLRASLPVGGRALTLYEEVHPQKKLANRSVQHRFLQRLAELLPPHAEPIIVADSGFKVPFFREVERLGWRWVGRLRGRDYVRVTRR